MESIHIRQRLRPSRYAFVVNEGDLGAALQAASLNAVLWGGIYNPIVPLLPREQRDGLLKAFDADLHVNLTGGDLVRLRFSHRPRAGLRVEAERGMVNHAISTAAKKRSFSG